MKKQVNRLIHFSKAIEDGSEFSILFFFSLFFAGYLSLVFGKDHDFVSGLFYIITSFSFPLLLCLILFCSTFLVYSYFRKNNFLLLRYSNGRNYFKELVLTTIFLHFYIIIIFVLQLLAFQFLFHFSNVYFTELSFYSVSNIVYVIYAFFKNFIIMELMCVILIFILCFFSKIFSFVFSTFVLFTILIYQPTVIEYIFPTRFFPGTYLQFVEYESFFLDLVCNGVYILLLIMIIFIIYKICFRGVKDEN